MCKLGKWSASLAWAFQIKPTWAPLMLSEMIQCPLQAVCVYHSILYKPFKWNWKIGSHSWQMQSQVWRFKTSSLCETTLAFLVARPDGCSLISLWLGSTMFQGPVGVAKKKKKRSYTMSNHLRENCILNLFLTPFINSQFDVITCSHFPWFYLWLLIRDLTVFSKLVVKNDWHIKRKIVFSFFFYLCIQSKLIIPITRLYKHW